MFANMTIEKLNYLPMNSGKGGFRRIKPVHFTMAEKADEVEDSKVEHTPEPQVEKKSK